MIKVAYNACYGGFSLSIKAAERLIELGVEGMENSNPVFDSLFLPNNIQRHDSRLIKIIEELGQKASGRFSKLKIAKINENKYKIDEYDGFESVITPDSLEKEWVVVDKE